MAGSENIKEKDSSGEQTLEELFEKLDEVMIRMEQPGITLEESFQLYHQGIDMVKLCGDKLDKIEKKVLMLDEEGECYEFK